MSVYGRSLCMYIFERLTRNQLGAHISRHRLLNQCQSGFQPRYPQISALIVNLSDYLYNHIGNPTDASGKHLAPESNILLQKLSAKFIVGNRTVMV